MLRPGRYVIREYLDDHGASRFREWLDLLDVAAQRPDSGTHPAVRIRELSRDAKLLGKGVYEARIMFGPGYRVYFGIHRGELVLLLAGGDKSTQNADIRNAQHAWRSFTESDHGS